MLALEEGETAADTDDNSCTHMVVMLNERTFSDGDATANMVRDALRAGINVLLVHEQEESRGARPFSHFFETTVRCSIPSCNASIAHFTAAFLTHGVRVRSRGILSSIQTGSMPNRWRCLTTTTLSCARSVNATSSAT